MKLVKLVYVIHNLKVGQYQQSVNVNKNHLLSFFEVPSCSETRYFLEKSLEPTSRAHPPTKFRGVKRERVAA